MSATRIYADWAAFDARADRMENGVTPAFADAHPGWAEKRGNSGCWNCSYCSYCSDCSDCSYCSYCSDCSDCSNCSDSFDCFGCSACSDSFDCFGNGATSAFVVPVLPHVHQVVHAAVTAPTHALAMQAWHTCATTHCRGGWVVALAGEAGRTLEEATSTLFAALQIYKASSPIRVSPVRFFDGDAAAMADIIACAEQERAAEAVGGGT
jgi:hypothetical protein